MRNKNSLFEYPLTAEEKDASFYFPNEFKSNRGDSIILSSISETLQQMGQVNLSIEPHSFETYRFTYRRAFHEPIVITISKDSIIVVTDYNWTEQYYEYDTTKLTNNEIELLNIWKKHQLTRISTEYSLKDSFINHSPAFIENRRIIDSLGRQIPLLLDTSYMYSLNEKSFTKKIVLHKQKISRIPLSMIERWKFIYYMRTFRFWSMDNIDNSIGLDGSEWILEANTKDGYYFVYSWEPTFVFKNLCMKYLKYADLAEEDIY